jgi:hypothetical protein
MAIVDGNPRTPTGHDLNRPSKIINQQLRTAALISPQIKTDGAVSASAH